MKLRVVLGHPKSHIWSQDVCSMSRLDRFHIVNNVFRRVGSGENQCVQDLIRWGETSICMALGLGKQLSLPDEPAHVVTVVLNGQKMAHKDISEKPVVTVHYPDHIPPVQESEVLVVPMQAYNEVLGLRCYQSRNPDVEWQCGRLLALPNECGADLVELDLVEYRQCPGNDPGSMAREEVCSEGGSGIADIQILRATAVDDLLASQQVIMTFCLRVGHCTGLLEATVGDITDGEWDTAQVLDGQAGSSCGSCRRRVST